MQGSWRSSILCDTLLATTLAFCELWLTGGSVSSTRKNACQGKPEDNRLDLDWVGPVSSWPLTAHSSTFQGKRRIVKSLATVRLTVSVAHHFTFEESVGYKWVKWARKAEIWKEEFLTTGEACTAIFWPTTCLKEGIFHSFGFSHDTAAATVGVF